MQDSAEAMGRHIPRVSVLMTVYNGMPYVPDAVESILRQSYSDLQLVIVDDGSTDATGKYLKSIQDERVSIVTKANGGTAAAANEGLRRCMGDYVARMDADDVSLPTRMAEQVAFLDARPEIGLVGTQAAPLGARGAGGTLALPSTHAEIYQALLDGRHGLMHSTLMMRTALLKQIGGYWSHRLPDDWDMMLRMGEVTQLANMNRVLFHWRVHNGSMSGTSMRRVRLGVEYACELARRRRDGVAPIDPAAFEEQYNRRPLWKRLAYAVELHARCSYRIALAEIHGPHPAVGYARLAWAGACQPQLAVQRIARKCRAHLA